MSSSQIGRRSVDYFNTATDVFLQDLFGILGSDDPELLHIKKLLSVRAIDCRAVITSFQRSVLENSVFVQNILDRNVSFFADMSVQALMGTSGQDMAAFKLVTKFQTALRQYRQDEAVLDSIFNHVKVLMFHASADMQRSLISFLPSNNVGTQH